MCVANIALLFVSSDKRYRMFRECLARIEPRSKRGQESHHRSHGWMDITTGHPPGTSHLTLTRDRALANPSYYIISMIHGPINRESELIYSISRVHHMRTRQYIVKQTIDNYREIQSSNSPSSFLQVFKILPYQFGTFVFKFERIHVSFSFFEGRD